MRRLLASIWLLSQLYALMACPSVRVEQSNDSMALAECVNRLRPWRYFYADEYAKANYYYGRYLRSVGNQPAAMQAFIDATHSHSTDYDILGRVYSNMAYMCRLEGNHILSYSLYLESLRCFENLTDVHPYYYAINNLAVQKAEMGEKDAAYRLLSQLETACKDTNILMRVYETKAFSHYHVQEYDSAILYLNLLYALGYNEPSGVVMKAQSYWFSNRMDSALHYAVDAMNCDCSLNDSINMLYILSHNDSSINKDSILNLSSERADKLFLYTRQQENLAHAVQLLEQDISRPYDWRWLYMCIAIVALITTIIGLNYLIKRHKRLNRDTQLYSQNKIEELEKVCHSLAHLSIDQLISELSWRDYEQMRAIVNTRMFNIVDALSQDKACLSEKEIRLCVLVLINLSREQMAELLLYAKSGMGKFKHSTAHKLGTTSKNMRSYLVETYISHIVKN